MRTIGGMNCDGEAGRRFNGDAALTCPELPPDFLYALRPSHGLGDISLLCKYAGVVQFVRYAREMGQ